jgi:hypothetical protein
MGMLCSCWCAWKGRRRNRFAAQLFWIWSLVTLLPLVGIFFSESLLLLTRLEPSWATPIHSALRHSVFWHLGFWEWTGAVAVFLFLCTAAFLTPHRPKAFGGRRSALTLPETSSPNVKVVLDPLHRNLEKVT